MSNTTPRTNTTEVSPFQGWLNLWSVIGYWTYVNGPGTFIEGQARY